MNKDTRNAIMVIAIVMIIPLGSYVFIISSSGLGVSPYTTVVSESMQHGTESKLGIIDTGDSIFLKSTSNTTITTYVEGRQRGYEMFGSFGDVIIYERTEKMNPVIHRTMLWLEYNGNNTWSAPSLKDYPSNLWDSTGDWNNLSGILTLHDLPFGNKPSISASINLDILSKDYPKSGYLTKGDNNFIFDQPSNISGVNGLITKESIKSVAWFEVPWIGAIKMFLNGNIEKVRMEAPNTINYLYICIISFIAILISLFFIIDRIYYNKYRKEVDVIINTPTPSFPLEQKNKKN